MAHARKKLAFRSVRPFRLFFGLVQLAFDALAISGIADRRDREGSLVGLERAETNLQRKFLAILTLSGQLEPGPHSLGAWILKKVGSMPRMLAPEAFRNQDLNVFPE